MRLRSSGIIAGKNARKVSGRAKRRTPGGSLESSRLASALPKLARLGSVADAA
jgi:hypothetical protein